MIHIIIYIIMLMIVAFFLTDVFIDIIRMIIRKDKDEVEEFLIEHEKMVRSNEPDTFEPDIFKIMSNTKEN